MSKQEPAVTGRDLPAKAESEQSISIQESESLRAAIEKQIGPLIGGGQGQRRQIIERVTAVIASEKFSGPIAHPRHLEHYERICPGAADRIIGMAERQLAHDHMRVEKDSSREHDDRRRGMYCGLIAFLAVLGCAAWCAYTNQPVLGAAFIGAGVIGGAVAFIKGRNGA